ncbi:MAG: phosphotransferase [Alphaproteobacteria bacterium]
MTKDLTYVTNIKKKLHELYGFDEEKIDLIEPEYIGNNLTHLISYNNNKYIFSIILIDKENPIEKISEILDVTNFLSKNNPKIPHFITLKNKKTFSSIANKKTLIRGRYQKAAIVLQEFIHGIHLDQYRDSLTVSAIKELAENIAEIHIKTKTYKGNLNNIPLQKDEGIPSVLDLFNNINKKSSLLKEIDKKAGSEYKEKIIDIIKNLENINDFKNTQAYPCHFDWNIDNRLYNNNHEQKLTGIIDFFNMERGPFLKDILSAVESLVNFEGSTQKHYENIQIFLYAYNEIRNLQKEEISALKFSVSADTLMYFVEQRENLESRDIAQILETTHIFLEAVKTLPSPGNGYTVNLEEDTNNTVFLKNNSPKALIKNQNKK